MLINFFDNFSFSISLSLPLSPFPHKHSKVCCPITETFCVTQDKWSLSFLSPFHAFIIFHFATIAQFWSIPISSFERWDRIWSGPLFKIVAIQNLRHVSRWVQTISSKSPRGSVSKRNLNQIKFFGMYFPQNFWRKT